VELILKLHPKSKILVRDWQLANSQYLPSHLIFLGQEFLVITLRVDSSKDTKILNNLVNRNGGVNDFLFHFELLDN
jgi:hypothetical protein